MRILFDHNVPRQLRRHLVGHDVDMAEKRGWATLVNGELLDRAEEADFEVLITTLILSQLEYEGQADADLSPLPSWERARVRVL